VHRTGREHADVLAANDDRYGQVRLQADAAYRFPVLRSVVGKVIRQALEPEGLATQDRRVVPRNLCLRIQRGVRREAGASPRAKGREGATTGRELGDGAPIGAEELGEETQAPLDLRIDLLDRQARETGRQLDEELFELPALIVQHDESECTAAVIANPRDVGSRHDISESSAHLGSARWPPGESLKYPQRLAGRLALISAGPAGTTLAVRRSMKAHAAPAGNVATRREAPRAP
jgi:hypothetical protein